MNNCLEYKGFLYCNSVKHNLYERNRFYFYMEYKNVFKDFRKRGAFTDNFMLILD